MITVSVPRVAALPIGNRPTAVGAGRVQYPAAAGYYVEAFTSVVFDHDPERGIAKGAAERLAKELREAAEQSLSRMKAEGLIRWRITFPLRWTTAG